MCSIRIIESKAITQLVLSIQQADRNCVAEWDRAIFQIAMNPREQPGETGEKGRRKYRTRRHVSRFLPRGAAGFHLLRSLGTACSRCSLRSHLHRVSNPGDHTNWQ